MYGSVPQGPMTFTKEQRLKGLRKQLKNLGYDAVPTGADQSEGAESVPGGESSADMSDRGAHKLDELVRNEEAF